ncbi:MAG: M20/M25/M40 family metallo-hydrolase [Deltaproteobacteria bacterium]|nr:M20/M25/M40 family metallo-hydrolase [Nannocystaceae bacterium]
MPTRLEMRGATLGGMIAIASCRGAAPTAGDAQPNVEVAAPAVSAETPKPAVVTSAVDLAPARKHAASITAQSLRRSVEALAADNRGGRPTPSPELDAAAAWIVQQHQRIGLTAPAGAAGHLQRFDCAGRGGAESSNVIGVLQGSDAVLAKQNVVVSAHYDHLGTRDGGAQGHGLDDPSDSIFNGANDDASGVAASLAIAEALAALSPRPRRSVVFIAFCGEELGLRGSKHWVDHPLVPLADTIAVVNLEMLGRPEPAHRQRVWVTGMDRSTMGTRMGVAARELGVLVVDGSAAGEFEGKLFRKSDNWPFAERKVVAHSFSTGVIDDHYHSVQDEVDTLDFEGMALLVQAIALGTYQLAQADDVPSWTESDP